ARAVAEYYGLSYKEVLTGFKYIGEQIKLFEEGEEELNYVFGLEESYGCLAGTHARDKDAVVAVMMLCELAAYYKKQGETVWDAMIDMYNKFGYYREGQYSITMKGKEGAEQIAALMDKLRNNPPKAIGSWNVLEFRDYKTHKVVDMKTGEESDTGLPTSNVLYFELDNDAWCCARPSGTEPKIKFYMGVKGENLEDSQKLLDELTAAVKAMIE
ncbi:MAG: phospho-sugar mutase, partial [Lachnospiraceae bacterium]|nr:phospho-sugar mutase [Lachnospiraceae bacterium]